MHTDIHITLAFSNANQRLRRLAIFDLRIVQIHILTKILHTRQKETDVHLAFFQQHIIEGINVVIIRINPLLICNSGTSNAGGTNFTVSFIGDRHDQIIAISFCRLNLQLERQINQIHIVRQIIVQVVGMILRLFLDLDRSRIQEMVLIDDGIVGSHILRLNDRGFQ